ncbi:hypothetical protein GCM10020331_039990 [Ectobacillus funiculus]
MTKLFIVNEKNIIPVYATMKQHMYSGDCLKKLTKKGGVVSFVSCVIQRKLTTVVWDGVFVKKAYYFFSNDCNGPSFWISYCNHVLSYKGIP